MADDDWESREDFDEILVKPPVKSDKWAGEDEDLDVKENWDDEEEDGENKGSTGGADETVKASQRKKKKKFKEQEKLQKDPDEELTPEQVAALKIREQKDREDHEIQIVKEAFGSSAICDSDPVTKDDFDALRKKIIAELMPFEKRPPYKDFIEDLIQDLALSLPAQRLKK